MATGDTSLQAPSFFEEVALIKDVGAAASGTSPTPTRATKEEGDFTPTKEEETSNSRRDEAPKQKA